MFHSHDPLNAQPVSLAFGINNKGQVVGIFEDFPGDNTTGFLWQDGVMTDLNTLIPPGSPLFLKEPTAINDRGEIVGFGLLSDGVTQRGFLLTPCDQHHPGVEGCDYSMVDATGATRVSPPPATQHPTGLTPGNRMPAGMLNRFRFPRANVISAPEPGQPLIRSNTYSQGGTTVCRRK
jgi:probable HAF family extracellular repeat protein